MFFYFAIFILLGLIAMLCSKAGIAIKRLCTVLIALTLIIVAGFKQPGTDLDSINYQYFFENLVGAPAEYFTHFSQNVFYEAGYYLLPAVLKSWFNADVMWFFLIIAILGVSLKFVAIWRLTEFQMLSIFIYFCHFFILHDMTQIREGIASAMLLLAVVEIKRKDFVKFMLFILFGTFFHYSALVFIPFYFLHTEKLNKKAFYTILIVPQILYFLKVNIISVLLLLRIGIISEKLNYYNELLDAGLFNEINVYNAVVIIQLLFCTFLIWKSDFLQTKNKYAILLIKIYTFALGSWVLFYSIPVLAFRISGFLEIVEIILVPFMLYYIEERAFATAFVFLFGFGLIYIDLIHSALLQPYELVSLIK